MKITIKICPNNIKKANIKYIIYPAMVVLSGKYIRFNRKDNPGKI